MVSPRVNPNLPPNFYELDEYAFQDLCCDLFSEQPRIATCDVYGKRGQKQDGIDLLAHCDDGISTEVGQCKCYEDFPPRKIIEASDEFFQHIDYWLNRKVRRFILFVGCDLSQTQRQKQIEIEKQRFACFNIQYEVWSASTIRQKLAPHPEIVLRYLRSQEWVEKICGRVPQPYPQLAENSKATELTFGVISSKLERLSSDLSKTKAKQLEDYRELYRQGHLQQAYACLEALRRDENWDVFDKPLQAQILQSLSGYFLSVEKSIEKAKTLAVEARSLDPEADNSLLESLIIYHTEGAETALKQIDSTSSIDIFNLKLGLLLEIQRTDEVITMLENLPPALEPDAETNRIHALAFLDIGDITAAQVKIQQACYEKPNWEKVQISEATINYYSVLSPAVPKRLINYPQPVDWSLIKRDDESLKRLRMAAYQFNHLASQTERGEKERQYWQVWYLACLANDPDRQSEAQDLCRTLLAEDPTNPQAIVWGTVRNYEIDLVASQQVLEVFVEKSGNDIERIAALFGIYIYFGITKQALELLNRNREKFEQTGNQELWLFWHIQALAINGEFDTAFQEAESCSNLSFRRSIQEGIRREKARMSGEWKEFAEYLDKSWQESRNGQYLWESCQLQASLQNWAYVADKADDLVNTVGTADALGLAAQCASQAGCYEQCFQLLNKHQRLFPGGNLPPYLRHFRAYCQAKLGLISQAVAEAEDLVRSQETVENLVTLIVLQRDQGNLRGVAITASRLLRHENVHPNALLQVARWLLSEDPELSRQLWQQAITATIEPEILGEVITLGYNLGLDREVQPFAQRARILAISGEGPFHAVEVHELLELQREWAENAASMNRKYDNAEAPIHLIAQARRLALTSIFRVLLNENANKPNPHIQPAVLIRYGARPFPEEFADSSNQWRLHLDISAFLLAAHLGILDVVERRFSPIRISATLPIALLQECEYFLQHQPSRLANHREIIRLCQSGQLRELSQSPTPEFNELIEQLGEQSTILLEQARAENGFVVEFLPLERLDIKGISQMVVLDEADQQRMINCRALVEVLKEEGILSSNSYETALNDLGDQRYQDLPPKLPARNDLIFVNSELANLLAGSNLLARVCRHFRVFVTHDCIREGQAAINAYEHSSEVIRWLRGLIQRVSTGLEQGKYEAIAVANPDSEQELELLHSWKENGLTVYDLFRYTPQPGDVIWIDDRFFSKYPYRDNIVPIIGVLEILEALRVKGDLSETSYYKKILQLRAGNIRYIPITSKEIIYHLKQAQIQNGRIQETEELTVMRRYVASCLLDLHRLQRPPMPEGSPSPDGEMMFVFECFRAIQDSIGEIWVDTNLSEEIAIAYSDWILENLYTGTFGVRHLLPNVDLNNDGLDFISQDISSLYFQGLKFWEIEINDIHETPNRRQQYFEWLEQRIIERRFRANPELSTSVAQLIKNIILYLGREQERDESLQDLNQRMLQQFYRDLPEVLKDELNTDPELMAYLQIQMVESINLTLPDSPTPLVFPALEFLPAIATAINDQDTIITALQPQTAFKIQAVQSNSSIQLRFINEADSIIYVWQDDVMLLASDNPNVREQVLRSHHFWFDCDNSRFEKVIGEILSTTDLRRRIDQANVWRNQSAAVFYLSFEQKLRHAHTFRIDELIPPSGAGLLRHFHLELCAAENLNFHEKLNRAAESLLLTEGLEICLERLACLPVKLPMQVREAFSQLPSSERQALLHRLVPQLASPLCKLHLIDLALLCPDSAGLVQNILDELFDELGEIHFRLFKAILNLLGSEFSYWSETREWVSSIQLAMIWAHASKLHNLLYHPTMQLEELTQVLERNTRFLPMSADILDRNPEFWNDVLHPRRLSRMNLVVHGLAAILVEHDSEFLKAVEVPAKIAAFAVKTVEGQQYLATELFHDDSSLAQNNLGSLLGGERSDYLTPLLGTDLGHQVASNNLKTRVENAIDTLSSEPLSKNEWLLIIGIILDLPIYKDLTDKLNSLVTNLNVVEIYKNEPFTAMFALIVASDHAVNTGNESLCSRLEQDLIQIASLINIQEKIEQVDDGIYANVLEIALKLAIRPNDPRRTSRSLNILLDKLFLTWLRFASRRVNGLFTVTQDLPANQLHGCWKTILLFRALCTE
ncbi:HTH domain-containing protein [Nostoc sp.]